MTSYGPDGLGLGTRAAHCDPTSSPGSGSFVYGHRGIDTRWLAFQDYGGSGRDASVEPAVADIFDPAAIVMTTGSTLPKCCRLADPVCRGITLIVVLPVSHFRIS